MGGKNSPKSINRYMAKAYDRINLTVPKGQKEVIKSHAEAQGESVNGFINRAIEETMESVSGFLCPTTYIFPAFLAIFSLSHPFLYHLLSIKLAIFLRIRQPLFLCISYFSLNNIILLCYT